MDLLGRLDKLRCHKTTSEASANLNLSTTALPPQKMISLLVFAVVMVTGTINCYKLSRTSVGRPISVILRSPHQSAQKGIPIILQSKVPTVQSIKRSLKGLGGNAKLSLSIFLKSPTEKKLLIMAYPLTIVLLYLLFTSTMVAVQMKRLAAFFTDLVNSMDISIRKTSQNISVLNKSFEKAKVEDMNTADKNIILESQLKEAEESKRNASDAYIAQARRDIEAKLQFIIQAEEKVKDMKVKEEEARQLSAALSVAAESFLVTSLATSDAALLGGEQEQSSIVVIKENLDHLPVMDITLNIPSSAVAGTTKSLSSADATVAMLFILAVSSPVLQVIHQYMISA